MFKTDQKQLYQELGAQQEKAKQVVPDAAESRKFWSDLWDQPVQHNSKAEWLSQQRMQAKSIPQQPNICITRDAVEQQLKVMANWKAPSLHKVHAFWINNFRKIHGRIAKHLQQCLTEGTVPEWIVLGRTKLAMKDETKGAQVGNYRPIACLPTTFKLLTGNMAKHIYGHLDRNALLTDERKGCRRNTRGTKDQILIDKMVLKNCRRRHTI